MLSSRQAKFAVFRQSMNTKKIAKVVLALVALLAVAAYLGWQLVGYGLKEFAKGGVC